MKKWPAGSDFGLADGSDSSTFRIPADFWLRPRHATRLKCGERLRGVGILDFAACASDRDGVFVTAMMRTICEPSTLTTVHVNGSMLSFSGAYAIATALGDAGISIDRMRQYGHSTGKAPVLIVTHKATRDALDLALAKFDATGVLSTAPVAIRIEEV